MFGGISSSSFGRLRNEIDRTLYFGVVALRVEDERDLGLVVSVPRRREVVHVEAEPRAGLQQAAGVVVERVAVLADRVLVQRDALSGVPSRRIRLDDVVTAWCTILRGCPA